jgi:predicted dehydrogenase|tara:strand:- start:1043 stop:2182 length:1140 start_codon:yes stop_codon:yes gene_type:complete
MKNKKKLYRLAIIGGSVDSAVGYNHLIASQMDHRFEIVSACFSKNLDVSKETIALWNMDKVRIYADWKSLISKEKHLIDAVAILTPTPSHYEMVMACLDLGIPTICEKSLASNCDEVADICESQKKNNCFLAVTHNYTGYPMVRELAALSVDGFFGKITHVKIEMPQEGFVRLDMNHGKPCPQAWRLSDGIIPGVSLDLGAHLQHMIHYITGENPQSLIGDQSTFGLFADVIDDVSIMARYPSGMKSTMWFSKSALGHRNGMRIRIYGSNGSAEWFQMEPENLIVHDIHGNKRFLDRAGDVRVANHPRYNRFKPGHPAGFIEAFANIYVDIADKLDEYFDTELVDLNWNYGAKQAQIVLKVLDLASKSSAKKEWVDVVL